LPNDKTGENAFELDASPPMLKSHEVTVTSNPRLDDLFFFSKISEDELWEVLFM
jgi:hypothetical protein